MQNTDLNLDDNDAFVDLEHEDTDNADGSTIQNLDATYEGEDDDNIDRENDCD